MELKNSLLGTWKFFSRFLNILTIGDNYSLVSRDNWMQTIQMHLSIKGKIFSEFLSTFLESALIYEHFEKIWLSELMDFRNYRQRKTCLDKILKGLIWEDPSTCDMVNGPKLWFSLNESAFIISSDHCEGNGVVRVTLRDVKILYAFF